MRTATRAAHGMSTACDSTKAASQSQALWRFLKNDSVAPTALVEPLQQAVREGCANSPAQFVLIMHDWCKLDYKRHASKKDVRQVTHEHDIGYDLTTSGASSSNFRVDRLQFATRVADSHLPIDATLLGIDRA